MKHLHLQVATICVALALNVSAQPVITRGNWQVKVAPSGPEAISYDGHIVVSAVRFHGYKPNWAGTRFSLGRAKVTTEGATATWHDTVEGNQTATLRLELSDAGPVLTLETTMIAAGPSEFSLNVISQNVATTPDHAFITLDGSIESLDLNATFAHRTVTQGITFERPERSLDIRCEHMQIQDRRKRNSDLFFVSVLGHSGAETRTVTRTVRITAEDIPEEQHAARRQVLAQVPAERLPIDVALIWGNYLDFCNFPEIPNTVLPALREKGVGVLFMKPLADGFLYRSPRMAFRYAMAQDADGLVSGFNSVEMLEEDLAACCAPTPVSDEEIVDVLRNAPELGTYVCRQCRNCTVLNNGSALKRIFELEGKVDRQMDSRRPVNAAEYALRERLKGWFGTKARAQDAYETTTPSAEQLLEFELAPCRYGIDIPRKLRLAHSKLARSGRIELL